MVHQRMLRFGGSPNPSEASTARSVWDYVHQLEQRQERTASVLPGQREVVLWLIGISWLKSASSEGWSCFQKQMIHFVWVSQCPDCTSDQFFNIFPKLRSTETGKCQNAIIACKTAPFGRLSLPLGHYNPFKPFHRPVCCNYMYGELYRSESSAVFSTATSRTFIKCVDVYNCTNSIHPSIQ